jgi:GntR family transcriptional repressor for pyruvate dehydrogenase complex
LLYKQLSFRGKRVTNSRSRSTTEAAAARLRARILAAKDGVFLGSEEALVTSLGVSRATVRQAARLLEREGLVKVRRGINGGYFGARPDASTIETAVAAYLDTLDMEAEDVGVVASVLWIEVMRQAASLQTEAARAVAARLQAKVAALRANASFAELIKVEQESRSAIFKLINGRYIELIFQINAAFAMRRFPQFARDPDALLQAAFLRDWKTAKLMELAAIAEGDPQLAMMAARHSRNIWRKRVIQAAERQAAGAQSAKTAP